VSASLTTRIPIRDRDGRVIDEKEVATYAGLLARAHDEGLKRIETTLVQVPAENNHFLAVAHATVETEHGVFTGIGDASPNNVNRKIAPHIVRMAETRAKARALRDAVNIGIVCLEELSDLSDLGLDENPQGEPENVRPLRPAHAASGSETRDRGERAPRGRTQDGRRSQGSGSDRMTDAQRRLLFRILSERGYEAENATSALLHDAGVGSLEEISKQRASHLIDSYRDEGERRGA